MTLEQIYLDQYVPDREHGMSPDTQRMALHALGKLAEFLGYPPSVADFTDDTLQRYVQWRVEVKHMRPSTVNGECRPLLALWRWCWKRRMVEAQPNVPPLPVERVYGVPEPWRFEDMQRLLAECKQARGLVGNVKASSYWLAYHYVQWDVEERAAIVLALRFDCLDWNAGRILLPSGVRGNGRKPRSMYLQPDTRNALRRIEQPQRALVFGDGVPAAEFRVLYKQLLTAAGLSWERYDSSPKAMFRAFSLFRQAAAAVGGVA